MTLAPGQQAKTYAIGKIARGGNTRGGYIPATTFVTIGGVHVATGATGAGRVLLESLTITDALDQNPNTCQFTMIGSKPSVGQTIVIALGTKNTGTPLFAGVVLQVDQIYLADRPDNVAYAVSAIDWLWQLDQKKVIIAYAYVSATAIAGNLIDLYASGYTHNHVAPNLPVLDFISFTNASLTEALTQLAKRIGGYFYVDYHKDLHLFVDAEGPNVYTPPRPLTPTNPTMRHVSRRDDLSQIITRVIYEGGGANAVADAVQNESILPVETAAWYNVNGGFVTSGPQRIKYATVFAGGSGSLVGPGAAPTAPPLGTVVDGAGLSTATYKYAYTYVTPSGESLPSALALVTTGALASPPNAPSLAVSDGAGPDPGVHQYAVTFRTAGGGETPGGPLANVTTSRTPMAPPTRFSNSVSSVAGGALSWTLYYGYTVTFVDDLGNETTGYPVYGSDFGIKLDPGLTAFFLSGVAASTQGASARRIYRTLGQASPAACVGAPRYRVATIAGNAAASYTDGASDASIAANPLLPTVNAASAPVCRVTVSLPVGAAGTSARAVYRTVAGGAQLKLVAVVANNTAISYVDQIADAALGANIPTVSTVAGTINQVDVSGIALGPAPTTSRKLYRTAGNGSQLKLVATLANNTATTYHDANADAALGANAPASDTSGITQPTGQVAPGSTSLVVAGAGAFRPGGGWALVAGGQAIRYTGITGNSLTGIPASGPGAILATISYNSTITAAPALEGIGPVSTGQGIYWPIKPGDPVNIVITVDDLAAQAQLAAAIGGDGVQEIYLQDNRVNETEARARASAYLALKNDVEQSLHYTSRDFNTRAGASVDVNLPSPTNMVGTYKLQQVTTAAFQFHPLPPTRTVEASSERFTFEDLLRLARSVTPPGA